MFTTSDISLKNEKAWRLIQNGHTIGVFQLESDLGKRWASTIKPSNINELSAVISLIRPACLEAGMTDSYFKVKFGMSEMPDYNDEAINKILEPTLGVLIYQEQLMKFGSEIAWSDLNYIDRLVIVDKLRKGIGKKDQKTILDLKDKFINGCIKNGRSKETSEKLFELIEGAGRYAFNDAHAKKYALWSYKTAYLKANFPLEFYCTYLTYSKGKQKPREEISDLINEARMLGIEIKKPDISISKSDFYFVDENGKKSIYFGLSHIKQVGENDAACIENTRPSSFYELLRMHFDASEDNKIRGQAVESLINSGACDNYGISRSTMNSIFLMLKELTKKEIEFIFHKKTFNSIKDLIDCVYECGDKQSVKSRKEIVKSEAKAIDIKAIDSSPILASKEKDLMGFSFTYDYNLNQSDEGSCKDCFKNYKNNKNTSINLSVKVSEISTLLTKKGKNPGQEMARFKISDNTGSINVVCFPEDYQKIRGIISEDGYYLVNLIGTGNGWSVKSVKIA
jgi:DNA polymerase-3 subunit alpha